MGGLFAFKRFYAKQSPNIAMHFKNPRSAMETARVKICKFNEIRISRSSNSSKRSSGVPHTTMIDEQEITDLTSKNNTQFIILKLQMSIFY